MDSKKTGSKYALLVGIPTGLAFTGFTVYVSSFYPFRLLLSAASLKVFWNPFSWLLVGAALLVSLWHTGKMIGPALKKYDVLKTSFLFTFWVNLRLMLVISAIYFYGIIANSLNGGDPFLAAIPYAILGLLLFFALATAITSVSVSLLIVNLTKNKLKVVQEVNEADRPVY
jgi:hypothetical protein